MYSLMSAIWNFVVNTKFHVHLVMHLHLCTSRTAEFQTRSSCHPVRDMGMLWPQLPWPTWVFPCFSLLFKGVTPKGCTKTETDVWQLCCPNTSSRFLEIIHFVFHTNRGLRTQKVLTSVSVEDSAASSTPRRSSRPEFHQFLYIEAVETKVHLGKKCYGKTGRLERCSNVILRHAQIPAQGQ